MNMTLLVLKLSASEVKHVRMPKDQKNIDMKVLKHELSSLWYFAMAIFQILFIVYKFFI